MTAVPDVAKVAALLGDASRVAMLLSLVGGKALPATELARTAGVSPQTASTHLAKLVEGGLLVHEAAGRHKYFRLAGSDVAHALEVLQAIAPAKPVRSLRESNELTAMRLARTCYDHLAGRLGVALTDGLVGLGIVETAGADYDLTARGAERLCAFGIDIEAVRQSRRQFARKCLDWSERRHHLAGSLGAALAARLFELGWVERLPAGRAVRLTAAGARGLAEEFGLEFER